VHDLLSPHEVIPNQGRFKPKADANAYNGTYELDDQCRYHERFFALQALGDSEPDNPDCGR
jgi:hypothetical protein